MTKKKSKQTPKTDEQKESTNDEPRFETITFSVPSSNQKKSEQDDDDVNKEIKEDLSTAAWMKEQVELERKRLEKNGAKVIIVPVKNTGIVRDGKKIYNRLVRKFFQMRKLRDLKEVNTQFDFDKITQLLVSDVQKCPTKENYLYVNIVLLTNSPVGLLMPYVFPKEKNNKLNHWMFINNQLKR